MSTRRRLLEIIATASKWLSYPFTYLYHALIPSTINSKNVKNKMRIKKIYGNSEVENQLITNGNFEDSSDWYDVNATFSVANNIATFVVSSQNGQFYHNLIINANHYYLAKATIKLTTATTSVYLRCAGQNLMASKATTEWQTLYGIFTYIQTGNTSVGIRDERASGWDNIQVKEVMCVSLTQRYPFDTPTALTDNRVQNILNNGYKAFNSGEIKSTNIGEFETEPYNLFDGELEVGWISVVGVERSDINTIRSKEYISIIPRRTYTLSCSLSGFTNMYVYEYDESKNLIYYHGSLPGSNIPSYQFTLKDDTKYVRFAYYKNGADFRDNIPPTQTNRICLHLTGTRTGYATHTNPQTLPFVYQGGGVGTAKNTLEKTATEWVFTRNVSDYTFNGNEVWTESTIGRYYSTIQSVKNSIAKPSSDSVKATMICDKMNVVSQSSVESANGQIGVSASGNIWVHDTSNITSVATATTYMTGKTIEYELATPQTIRIPKKHLACVDLGTLTYTIDHNTHRVYATLPLATPTFISDQIATIYCGEYMTIPVNDVLQGKVGISKTSNVSISDFGMETFTTTQQVQAFLSGIYLYYETQDEVADIDLTMNIESGGTFTSNFFSWVENQLVSNGNFATTNSWLCYTGSLSVSNNIGTYTLGTNGNSERLQQNNITTISGHKYLLTLTLKSANATTINVQNDSEHIISNTTLSANTKKEFVAIYSATNSGTLLRFYVNRNGELSQGNTIEYSNIQYIDLTLGFGAGNEPTSINDTRIQYIINHGYIPTNTTGTNKSVDTEVLPNVDTEVKC